MGIAEVFELVDKGYLSEWTILATYKEPYMLTGFTVSESFGSDLGLFYSEDAAETIRANLLLGYDFLRNSTTHLADMPSILANYDSNVESMLGSFSNMDAALVEMSNTMLPQALSSLLPNQVLPVTICTEENFTIVEMSQLVTSSYILGDWYSIDLVAELENELTNSRSLKTNFYNTTSYEALEIEDIMRHINGWQLSEDARFSVSSLVLMWNTGEQSITRVGAQEIDAQLPEEWIYTEFGSDWFVSLARALARGYLGLKAYDSLKLLRMKGWNSASIARMLKTGGKTGGFRLWAKMCNKLTKAKEGWAGIKAIQRLKTWMNGLKVLGGIIDVGLSILAGFIIADQIGGHLGKAIGAAYGLIAATYAIAYTAILFVVGQIPVVGWIISLAIILADIFGGFSDILMGWFMDWFGPDDLSVVTPWLDITVTNITVWDKDNNGLDVGDRVSITVQTKSKVNVTSGRETGWAAKSWYRPYISISAPWGSFSNTSMTGIPPEDTWIVEQGVNWKTEEYETGAWIEPGIGMPNFPVTVRINFDYRLWHIWEHFEYYGVYGEWCRHEDRLEGVSSSRFTTLRYDVLPGSIDDFARWRGVTPLDHDGDGLRDSDETTSDPWKYDSDADGLNDKYEVDIGTDPREFDTDKDGLIDWFELVYDTNTTEYDTDGDGLRDFLEVAGWVISFNYTDDPAKPFTTRVYSDPRVPDTDGDGVDDYIEYWSGLNPRSSDTNGDGIDDVANPRFYTTRFEFVTSWNVTLRWGSRVYEVMDMAIDANGDIYVTTYDSESVGYVVKYSPNGTLVSFPCPIPWLGNTVGRSVSVAVDDKNGYIHVFDRVFGAIFTFGYDGTLIRGPWGEGVWPRALAVDSEGYVYAARGNPSTLVTHPDKPTPPYWPRIFVEKYHSNGTFITSWGSTGTAPEKFLNIDDMAIDRNGIVYISDIGERVGGDVPFRDDRIAKFDVDGNYRETIYDVSSVDYGIVENHIPWLTPYWGRLGVAVDEDNYLYIADSGNHRILKYDQNGWFINSTGSYGWEDGNFIYPCRVAVSSDGYVYVVDGPDNRTDSGEERIFRIQKFSQEIEPVPPFEDPVPDRDGDGLENTAESAGWDVTFTNTTGTFTIHVTSDALLNDTDFEGLSDYNESQIKTHPRDPDTDDDGLSDYAEWRGFPPQTNPKHWDTDGDGLGDGVEITYGSDPTKIDTDGEGLIDPLEFLFNSDPNDTDTDDDGLSDYEEYMFNSDPTNPDSDDDFMFDGYEKTAGTDPQDSDTDNDNLLDGHETLLGTDPLNGDTDGDNLTDGTEVMLWLNPLSNDTDQDGLLDCTELEYGTNPFSQDTDGDGIPDSEDDDSFATCVDEIILTFDQNNEASEFAEKLAQYTNVTIVSVDDLLLTYKDEPYIVIVGDPDGNGAAGQLVNDLLADCGDVLTKMIEADVNRFAVRHGIWNETQTVVLLSQPYPEDHCRVLDILKGKIVTIQPDSATVEIIRSTLVKYPAGGSLNHTAISCNFIKIAEIDTVKQTDSTVSAVLEQEANATFQLHRYNNSTTPFSLTHTSGLAANEHSVGKYLEINVSENLQNQTSDIISKTYIQLYYRLSDLDTNGDGDTDDPEDLREDTLAFYLFDESSQTWIKLSKDLDWVIEIGVNTTNIELYGESYEGYVWADLTHFSLYGLAALPVNRPPNVTGAYPSVECLWPPNHRYVDVTILGVTDPDGDNVTITVTGVTSDEPTDGKHSPDAYGVGTDTVSLRAERLGAGNGRVYMVTFIASDGKGGEAEGNVTVYVPHHKTGHTYFCIDDGQNYDATKAAADDDMKPKTQTQAESSDDQYETEEDNTDTENQEPNEDSYQEEPANSNDKDENDDAPEGEEVVDKGEKSKGKESKDESFSGEDEDQNAQASDEEESGGEGVGDEGEDGKVPEKEEKAEEDDAEGEESKDKKSEDQRASGKDKHKNDEASDDNLEGEGAGLDDGKEKGGGPKGNESTSNYQDDDEKGVKDEKQSRDERKLEKETEKKPKKNSD
ncbi:MAG: hypothetical protein ACETWE_12265 [Candidatus Bathyarchaeia archaeon]